MTQFDIAIAGVHRRRAPLLRVVAVGVLAVLLTACQAASGDDAGAERTGGLRVVTTVAPLTSIVAAVGGDLVDVTGVVPEGTNSHTFEPPPSVGEVLSRADVVFLNGLSLEEPFADLAHELLPPGAEVVALGDRVLPEQDYIYDFSFPREDGKPNPHLWTDPTYAIRYAEVVRDTLSRRDPEHAAAYRASYADFARSTSALSDALRAAQETVPGERRLLTYHDAYAYFARTYDWEVVGAVQPKDFEDPTPVEVAALIDQVRELRVPVIFGSEVFPSKVLETIGQATGTRYEDTLRDDDLPGAPGDPEHSWWGLMRYNFATMVRGLGGDDTALRELAAPSLADRAEYPQ